MERSEIQIPKEADTTRTDADTNLQVLMELVSAEKDRTKEESPRFRLNPFWHTEKLLSHEQSANFSELPKKRFRSGNNFPGPIVRVSVGDEDLPVDTPGFREVSFRLLV